MKFRKLGQALLVLAGSVVLGAGVVSCGNNYPVAYLYTSGSQYNQIEGFSVANATGALTRLTGSPLGSGGTDPRKVLVSPSGTFLYVINSGCAPSQLLAPSGEPACSGTGAVAGTNVSLFSLSGNGTPHFITSYQTAGLIPLDMAIDSSGGFLYVLDAYAPTAGSGTPLGSSAASTATPCADPTDATVYHPVGDVEVFSINTSTGALASVSNSSASLPYTPIGCNPVSMTLRANALFIAQAGSATSAVHGSDVSTVQIEGISSGQLSAAGTVATGGSHLTGIGGDRGSKYIYVLDAGPDPNDPANPNNPSYVIPYSIGSGGALTELQQGPIENSSASTSNQAGIPAQIPTSAVVESEGKFLYVGNQGTTFTTTTPNNEITAFYIDPSTGALSYLTGEPFGSGSGSQCLLEDPSNQYLYSANFNDSTVTGRLIDHNAGVLNVLTHGMTFGSVGQTIGCSASGHTQ